MSTVINRVTKEVLVNVDLSSFPTEDWIHNPSINHLYTIPKNHWTVDGNTVREMTQDEKDAAEPVYVASLKEAYKKELRKQVVAYIENKYDTATVSFFNAILAEAVSLGLANRKQYVIDVLDYVRSITTHMVIKQAEVDAVSDEGAVLAVELDLTQFDSTDPLHSPIDAMGIPD